jgi:DNA polymerase-3 subunit gamma/tau
MPAVHRGRSFVRVIPPHQAIYRRWRAQTFDQIVGQEPVVETLRNAVRTGRTAHALLFVGPRGTGKTSMARIVAKALNCPNLRDGEPCDECPSCVAIREGRALDVDEFDAASNNTVGDMRDLLPRVFTAPSDLTRKVFIVDEVQRITQGWDVLLKTLEEPPDHAVFIFCTTDSSQIRPAVLSRVQRFDFRRLTVAEIAGKLRAILEADGREAEPEAVELIARLAAGGMRDAESMLDQLLTTDGGRLTVERVRDVLGLVDEETIDAFLRALIGGDALAGIDILDALDERGRDLRAFVEQAIDRLRVALMAALGRPASASGAALGASPAALTDAARRLAAIDPVHPGPGGLRLQLELAVLGPADRSHAPSLSEKVEAARPGPATSRPRPEAAELGPVTAPAPEPGPAPIHQSVPAPRAKASRSPEPKPAADAPTQPKAAGPAPELSSAPESRRTPEPKPAPEPGPAAQLAAPKPSRPGPSLELLLERWAEIVEVLSKDPPTKPLILACRPVSVDGDVVTLGFPETQSFLKDVAERRRSKLEDGVGRALGMAVSVRCVAANVEVAAIAADPDGSRLMDEFRKIFGDDVVDVGDVS